MDKDEAVRIFNLPENESKNYFAAFTLISLTAVDRYFYDKKDISGFSILNLPLLFFKFFISTEKYAMCSNKIAGPLFYKVSEINETWFSVSGVRNTITYNKNILPLLKIDNYPLDLTIVNGNTCNDKMLKEFILNYDIGNIRLEEKKVRKEGEVKSVVPEKKIILETPHN